MNLERHPQTFLLPNSEFSGQRGLLRPPFEKAHAGGLKALRGDGGGAPAALQ